MHKSNPCLGFRELRYDKEGLGGLQDRTKDDRLSELSEETSYRIKK
jgi:hypothetical protein